MRLLLVNANTSRNITEHLAAEARLSLPAGWQLSTATGAFGAAVIQSRRDCAIAEHACIEAAEARVEGCDAVVVGVSLDIGLWALRQTLNVPVVGLLEASLMTACMVSGRYGLVVMGRQTMPLYRELVARHGQEARLAGIEAICAGAPEVYAAPEQFASTLVEAANRLVASGAESVILVGAVVAGMHRRLQPRVAVPLLDGMACAVTQACGLAGLVLPKAEAGSVRPS
ncbi:aspartate/glutamate racemase family protein [Zobellella maritima]|uniref:aspartate/glutamate racemase family protein n=1 Tax=Zobellella maritima TaxID=2059725 RepID=UPI000E302939|nr:aspartate/glutamate racemase family protein [Zobellella maritima]